MPAFLLQQSKAMAINCSLLDWLSSPTRNGQQHVENMHKTLQ